MTDPRITARLFLSCVAFTTVQATPLAAQSREIQRYEASDAEGRLMAFYSAVLAFSPLGQPAAGRAGSVDAVVELSFVPPLNASQRSAGYDKPEATNLAPVFPRPRLKVGLPARSSLELSWLPPVRLFGVTANLAAAALSVTPGSVMGAQLSLRASGMAGRVTGPITCNSNVADDSPDLRTYYRTVCRNRDSRDDFVPRHRSLELIATRSIRTLAMYGAAGARFDAGTRFDIGVARADGSYRDPDHPVLELRSVRAQVMGGVAWNPAGRWRVTGEVFYAPGSVLTVRTALAAGLRQT